MTDTNVIDLHTIERATVEKAQSLADGIALVSKWRRILSVRWLAAAAVAGALAVWTLTVADPMPWRFIGSCGYSVGVLVPVLWLYWATHKGD